MNSKLTEAEHERAFRFCVDYLGGCWNKLTLTDLSVRKLSGGMSNLLYHCALKDWIKTHHDEPRDVLLRLYGRSHGDTEVQLEIFNLLASENLGPKLYVAFKEGRLEQYLPSSPLSWAEMTSESISATIATKLAAIHKLNIKCLDRKSNWLTDNYHLLNSFIMTTGESLPADSLNVRDSTKKIAAQLLKTNYTPEINFLDGLLRESESPMVFSHNDLHQNNIILLSQLEAKLEDRVVLIDYEYSSYNYRPFDLANHLMERCFDYDGDEYPHFSASFERFPSKQQQKQFLAHYLGQETNSTNPIRTSSCDRNNHSNGHSDGHNFVGDEANEDEFGDDVESLYREMQPFLMASNLLWALWAIRSACTSEIAFGYWEMAKWKWDLYLFCKERFVKEFMQ